MGDVPGDWVSEAIVHCFRCDTVVEVARREDEVVWCPQCAAEVEGPGGPGSTLRWTPEDPVPAPVRDGDPFLEDARPRRRHGSSMLAAGMLGLHNALYGPVDDEAPIVHVEDEPDRDDDVEVHLEESPTESWVRFRQDRRD